MLLRPASDRSRSNEASWSVLSKPRDLTEDERGDLLALSIKDRIMVQEAIGWFGLNKGMEEDPLDFAKRVGHKMGQVAGYGVLFCLALNALTLEVLLAGRSMADGADWTDGGQHRVSSPRLLENSCKTCLQSLWHVQLEHGLCAASARDSCTVYYRCPACLHVARLTLHRCNGQE